MGTIDFGKKFKQLYRSKARIEEVDADRGVYYCVTGRGAPGGEGYVDAIQVIRLVGYTLTFQLKSQGVVDFKVSRLTPTIHHSNSQFTIRP